MQPKHLSKDIENLTDARNVRDLAHRLQKILNVLQYYAEGSETAILEHAEGWRDEFTHELRNERNSEAASKDSTGIPGIPQVPVPVRSQPPRRQQYSNNRAPPQNRLAGQPRQNRQANDTQGELPAALAAIMDGTHHSFKTSGQNPDGMFGREF